MTATEAFLAVVLIVENIALIASGFTTFTHDKQ